MINTTPAAIIIIIITVPIASFSPWLILPAIAQGITDITISTTPNASKIPFFVLNFSRSSER